MEVVIHHHRVHIHHLVDIHLQGDILQLVDTHLQEDILRLVDTVRPAVTPQEVLYLNLGLYNHLQLMIHMGAMTTQKPPKIFHSMTRVFVKDSYAKFIWS